MRLLCEIIWFLLPAGFANMAPVFAARFAPRWRTPVDLGARVGGVRVFGDHKTVRGLVAGMFAGGAVFLAQARIWQASEWVRSISMLEYGAVSPWFGVLMAAGALGGDLAKSFFKRRLGRKPGQPWFPFDQIDWTIGALAATWPIVRPEPAFALTAVVASLLLSIVVKFSGYLLHLDEKPI